MKSPYGSAQLAGVQAASNLGERISAEVTEDNDYAGKIDRMRTGIEPQWIASDTEPWKAEADTGSRGQFFEFVRK